MRYGDLCEEKLFNAKILHGNARVLELLWAMRILEVSIFDAFKLLLEGRILIGSIRPRMCDGLNSITIKKILNLKKNQKILGSSQTKTRLTRFPDVATAQNYRKTAIRYLRVVHLNKILHFFKVTV